MPKVNVEHSVSGSCEDVYQAIKKYLTERNPMQKLGGEIIWEDKTHSAAIEADQFSGDIGVSESGGESTILVTIDLPFLMAPFKGKVKEELSKHLSKLKV